MSTIHQEAAQVYRSFRQAVRLTRMECEDARLLQRKERTMREIAQALEVPVSVVQQSLYFDVVAR
ncbi:hypothetical protein VW35_00915 [Devosia soli]|uniref:Uncharacterized protein n=1 Tax=Devosia soli TaxID=361041 RepID=A0A0F5LGV2_9HYPH|nr:hypothetical protein [Devosia soli]KKB80802.1 hypothetical protein VW35_00915 [Devosia soli]